MMFFDYTRRFSKPAISGTTPGPNGEPAPGTQRTPCQRQRPWQDDVFGWPSIAPIKARKAQQSNYPVEALPEEIQLVLMATVRLAGCSTHTAAASLMGSLSLLAQVDYTVQTLAPTAKPTSLFMLAISESGWRKSEAAQLLMSGHREADSRAVALHTMAKQQYEEEQKSGKKKGQENSPRPRTFQPLSLSERCHHRSGPIPNDGRQTLDNPSTRRSHNSFWQLVIPSRSTRPLPRRI